MDSQRGDKGEGGRGWVVGGQQKLPMLASQCGYVMRARDTDTHTHARTLADTHSRLSMAPRLISGTQRPQTEVAEKTQWEQGLKAWFTSAPREGVREAERNQKSERHGPTVLDRRPGAAGWGWWWGFSGVRKVTEAERSFVFVLITMRRNSAQLCLETDFSSIAAASLSCPESFHSQT